MSDDVLLIIAQYLNIYVGFFALIIGSMGNVFNIMIFLGTKKYRILPSSIFLAAASIGEELTILSYILPQSIASATGHDIRAASSIWCKLCSLLYTGGGVLGLSSLYMGALDRYLQTSRSATRRQWMNLKRARIIIVITALFSAILGTPFAVFRDVIPSANICDNIDAGFTRFAFYFYALIGLLSPTLLLGALIFLTCRNLKETRERQGANQNAQILTQHVTRMILVQTSAIFVSILPGAIVSFYGLLSQKDSLITTPKDILIFTISEIFVYTNSCTSFYVYLITSTSFRQQAKYMLLCRIFRRNQIEHHLYNTKSANLNKI